MRLRAPLVGLLGLGLISSAGAVSPPGADVTWSNERVRVQIFQELERFLDQHLSAN